MGADFAADREDGRKFRVFSEKLFTLVDFYGIIKVE